METKELKVQIPEGQEIDWQESAKQEKIVLKKKENTIPRSWEEYCNNVSGELFYFGNQNSIESVIANDGISYMAKNYLPSKKLAEAFLAMMQLMSLRHNWIHKWSIYNRMDNDWEPDWKDCKQWKANILYGVSGIDLAYFGDLISAPLSFPTREMAKDFMYYFKDLLDIAKPLI